MRELFRGYYPPSKDELATLWHHCVFVLDANVLLNLYRYPQEARTDLLALLEQIQNRLWVPYQAALEYQQNRLSVVAEQVKRFTEVRKVLAENRDKLRSDLEGLQLTKRHSFIDPEPLIAEVEKVFTDFERELSNTEKQQPDVFDQDSLRDRLDQLLVNRVGDPPRNQADLDQLYQDGKIRYGLKRPPGYGDLKNKKEEDVYTSRGLVHRRLYGDLILWREIINKAKSDAEFKQIIFVTDDKKEDWWWVVESHGKKTIGPRPELVEEMFLEGGVDGFYMYNSQRFLEFAKTNLGARVQQESIEQVRNITERGGLQISSMEGAARRNLDLQAVLYWLFDEYPDTITEDPEHFSDFLVHNESSGREIAYVVKHIRDARQTLKIISDVLRVGSAELNSGKIHQLNIVLIIDAADLYELVVNEVRKIMPKKSENIRLIVGFTSTPQDGDESPKFLPMWVY